MVFLFSGCAEQSAVNLKQKQDFVDSSSEGGNFDGKFSPTLESFEQPSISLGSEHSCYINSTNSNLYCWGNNTDGQLGGANSSSKDNLIELDVSLVDSAGNSNCLVDDLGDVYCWGENTYGQLGTGDIISRNEPTLVLAGQRVTSIAVSKKVSCAVSEYGPIYCWGDNTYGQLGTGDTLATLSPRDIDFFSDESKFYKSQYVSTSQSFSCLLNALGNVLCWGDNAHGQLGTGDTQGSLQPKEILSSDFLNRFQLIETSDTSVCGIHADGDVYCWGANTHGQLGTGDTLMRNEPTMVLSEPNIISLSLSNTSTCALSSDGPIYCWGDAEKGKISIDSTDLVLNPVQINTDLITGINQFKSIGMGTGHMCILSVSNNIYCSGDNSGGQLGLGFKYSENYPFEVKFESNARSLNFSSILVMNTSGTSDTSFCGLVSGNVYCWGDNTYGQLGTGDTLDREEPTLVLSGNYIDIANANFTVCAVNQDGDLPFCWGDNRQFQAGHRGNNVDYVLEPYQLNQPTNFSIPFRVVKIEGHGKRFVALIEYDLTVNSVNITKAHFLDWGLFDPTDDNSFDSNQQPHTFINDAAAAIVPTLWDISVGGMISYTYSTYDDDAPNYPNVSPYSSVVFCTDSLGPFISASYCLNGLNFINTSNTSFSHSTIQNTKLYNFANSSCRDYGSGLICSGSNVNGELGVGSTASSISSAATINFSGYGDDEELIKLSGKNGTSRCSLHDTGEIHCWGNNSYKAVGIGSGPNLLTPEIISDSRIISDSSFIDVSVGHKLACGVLNTGKLVCWGATTNLEGGYEYYVR